MRARKSSSSAWYTVDSSSPLHGVVLAPGLVALGERARARQGLVELAVGGLERLLVGPARTDAVAALHLVLVGDLLAGQLARDGLQPAELGAQPAAALLVEPARRRVM